MLSCSTVSVSVAMCCIKINLELICMSLPIWTQSSIILFNLSLKYQTLNLCSPGGGGMGGVVGGRGVGGGCSACFLQPARSRGVSSSRTSQTLSRRVALSSVQLSSLLLWRTAAAQELARAGSRSNTSQEVRRNVCSDSCRSIDSESLAMKPPKHFPLQLTLTRRGCRGCSGVSVWRAAVNQTA